MAPITAPYEEYENQRDVIFTMPAQPVDCTRRLPIHASVKTGTPPASENRSVNRMEPPMPIRKFRLPPTKSEFPDWLGWKFRLPRRKSVVPARKNSPIA